MRKRITIASLTAICSFALSASGQDISLVNSLLYKGFTYDVVVSSGYIYAATDCGMFIVDAHDSTSLFPEGGIYLGDYGYKIAVEGNYAYIANNHRGLQIVDVSDPINVMLAGRLDTERALSLDLQGNYAYIADGGSGNMVIADISDPQAPVQVGVYHHQNSGFTSVAISGNIACLADTLDGLQIIDIGNPQSPVHLASIQTSYDPKEVEIQDTLVYVVGGYSYYWLGFLEVFNISNPHSPSLIGNVNTYLSILHAIAIRDQYAYIVNMGDMTSSVEIYDISDPTNIRRIGSHIIYSNSIFLEGNDIFLTDIGTTIRRFAIGDPLPFREKGAYHTPDRIEFSVYANDFIYVSDRSMAIYPVDVSDPSTPVAYNFRSNSGQMKKGQVSENYLYAASYYGLYILSLSRPDSIVSIGRLLSNPAGSVAVQGQYAFLGLQAGGIESIDVSDPVHPDSIAYFGLADPLFDIKIRDNYAFLAAGSRNGLKVVSIASPDSLYLISELDTPGRAKALSVSGNYAFVADSASGLAIIDISNVAVPDIAGTCQTPGPALDVETEGHYAYVACDSAGIAIIDFADPTNLVIVAEYDTPGKALDVSIAPPYIFVSDYNSLVTLRFDLTPISDDDARPDNFSLSQNYPNPFNASTIISFSLPQETQAEIVIFDILGREIRRLPVNGRESQTVWDGANAAGSPVSSGVYFYSIAGHPETARRMLLLR